MNSIRTSDILVEIISPVVGGDGEFRTISEKVLSGQLALPDSITRKRAVWHESLKSPTSKPSDIVVVSSDCVRANPICDEAREAAMAWMQERGLPDLRERASVSPLGCVAASFHHDLSAFGDSVFCVVWTEEDCGLELVFPDLDVRVPLSFGTIVVFDAGQPHGVIRKGLKVFNARSYTTLPMQTFLSFDFGAAVPGVPEAMGITLLTTDAGWPGYVDYSMEPGFQVQRATGKWITPKRGRFRPEASPQ